MKRLILATVASAALCVPALAQQGAPQNQQNQAPHATQSQTQLPTGQSSNPSAQRNGQFSQSQTSQPAQGGQQPNQFSQGNQFNSNVGQNGQKLAGNQLNSTQVREIQRALDSKGFQVGGVDGIWGPETEMALKAFQKSQNMPQTGEIDSMTVASLGLDASAFGMNPTAGQTTGQAPRGQNQNTGGSETPQRGGAGQPSNQTR